MTPVELFCNAILKHKASITGVIVDKNKHCGKILEPFCDKIYRSMDITEEKIAQQILSNRAYKPDTLPQKRQGVFYELLQNQ